MILPQAAPHGWQSLRLKDLCVGLPAYGTNISADAYADEGLRFIRTTDLDDYGRLGAEGVFISPEAADETLRHGDLLVSRSGTVGRSFLYCRDHGPATYAGYLIRLRFRDSATARFAFWFTKSSQFFAQIEADAVESTIANFNGQKYAALRLLIPNDPAQRAAIADFLDRETAKIDTLIERASAFATLLEESRCAVLAQAISTGLDSGVELRPTGVPWWPEIPAHWKIKCLKFLVKPSRYITYGIVQAGPDIPDGVPYIRTSDLSGDELPTTGYLKTSHEIDNSYRRSRVATGELVIAIRATVGKTLKVPPELDGANLTQGTARISPNTETSSEYLFHVLNSPAARSGFMSMAKGATFKEITLDMLRNFPVPVPPLAEQAAIVAALDADAIRYRRTFGLVEEQRQRLLEHRSALITAAVTGQIEVAANIAAEAAA